MSEHIIAILTLLSLAFIWIGAFWLHTDYSIDLFRQQIFKLRDALFDDAIAGKIPFDHPAYGIVRMTLNGLSRYGHRINLVFLFGTYLRPETSADLRFKKRLEKHFGSLSVSQRELIDSYVSEMNDLVLKRIFLGSPLLLVLFVLPLAIYDIST